MKYGKYYLISALICAVCASGPVRAVGFFSYESDIVYASHEMAIDSAVQYKYVRTTVTGFSAVRTDSVAPCGVSGHFGPCLMIIVENLTSAELILQVLPGMMLNSEPDDYQDMVITREERLTMGPHDTVTTCLFAMCAEMKLAPPDENVSYAFWGMAQPELVKVARFYSMNWIQDYEGQLGIWSITDGYRYEGVWLYAIENVMRGGMAPVTGETEDHSSNIRVAKADPGSEEVNSDDFASERFVGMTVDEWAIVSAVFICFMLGVLWFVYSRKDSQIHK